jgi:competence protein ComEA
VRPPSGYTEFDPHETLLERWTRRWSAHAALSRRAVLALVVLGLLAVGATLMALRDRPQTVEPNAEVQMAAGPVAEESAVPGGDVVVHVGGDVADPGLYTMPPGSRVSDAVDAAGGPLPDADLDQLNLARPLTDGEQILVGPPSEDTADGTSGSLINVNRADAAALETLPGIGEVIAANIIAYREEHGPFARVEDLVNVSKIGDAVLADIAPLVTVG